MSKITIEEHNLRIEFQIKINSADHVVTDIKGATEIPSFAAPDATTDSKRIFENVFEAIIHRPCAIGINRLINGILETNQENRKRETKQSAQPARTGFVPLPPLAETLNENWPTAKAA